LLRNLKHIPNYHVTTYLDVLGHDGDTFAVDGTQVGVLKEPNNIELSRLLQGQQGHRAEPQLRLEVLGVTRKAQEVRVRNCNMSLREKGKAESPVQSHALVFGRGASGLVAL
jgi:hypothetical protein